MTIAPVGRFEIPDELLARLREDVVSRRIESGIEWFHKNRDRVLLLDPAQPNAAAFVGYFSQWIDIGYGDVGIVRELLRRFPREVRATLPLNDYVHLRLAEGMVASDEENAEEAIAHFDFILSLGEDVVADRQVLSLAHFWKARCQRKRGEYDSAMAHTVKARELALELGCPRMAAVMQVLESWLHFQHDRLPQAKEILESAEAVLRETDDWVNLGNIHSGYGRIAMQEGRLEHALEHFARAIEAYRKRDPRHRNLARSLANMANARRLIALGLARRIDTTAEQRRKSMRHASGTNVTARQRFEQMRNEAFLNLDQAEEIYRLLSHHRGLGTVRIDRGFLLLDNGDLESSAIEAGEAYELGAEKKDRILMARARILESMIETARFEEGIGDEDGALHAQRARDYSVEALVLARQTENRPLLAQAYICHATALSQDLFNNMEAAREYCDRAGEYLRGMHHDQLWEEHQTLKARLLRAGSIDGKLREWSEGSVGGRTFQQMMEEFADLIIPKVWQREGRKVSRVAAKLSISPKKVRRILARTGHKTG